MSTILYFNLQARKPDFPIHPMILSRISAREITTQPVSDTELFTLLEAARWAPSYYNDQPWRFIYVRKNTPHWNKFWDLLWPLNQMWMGNATLLVTIVSTKYYNYHGNDSYIPTHSFDAGAAWMAMALEGVARGLIVHALGGMDYERAYEVLGIDQNRFHIEIMVVIGHRPKIGRRTMSESVSGRTPIKSFVTEGVFKP